MLSSPLRGLTGQSGGGGSGGPLFIPGAQFDGVSDIMVNNAFPLPATTSFLTARFSFYLTGAPGSYYVILVNNSAVLFYIHSDGHLQFVLNGVASSIGSRSTNPIPLNTWQTVLFACDTNHASGSKPVHLWINGVNSLGIVEDQYPAFNIVYDTSVTVGSLGSESLKFDGALAGMWVGCGQYLDFSNPVNRLKFTDVFGNPKKDIGVDGSLPTGTAPDIYLNHNYLSFQTNEGTAGDFTVYGALSEPGSEVPAA